MTKGLKCFNCGKGIMYGHNVSHAKNRTRKIFKPNLHSARILVNGVFKRVRLCTKCLRLLRTTHKMQEVVVETEKTEEAPLVAPISA